MSHKVYYVYDLISSMRIPRFNLHFHEEGGGDDDEHGEGVLGQGGGAGSRWGEELEKGDFFLLNSSSPCMKNKRHIHHPRNFNPL